MPSVGKVAVPSTLRVEAISSGAPQRAMSQWWPHVVVEPGRHGAGGHVGQGAPAGHADLDGPELAEVAVSGQLAGEAEVSPGALLRAHLEDAAVAADGLAELAALTDG